MNTSQSGRATFWIIGILVLVVVLLLAGGGAWWFLHKGPASAHAATPTSATALPPAKPIFFKLDPFTVNLQADAQGNQLLYVGITLEVGNEANRLFLQEHLPQVRDRLLMVLSGQNAGNLITGSGKQQLATTIRAALEKPFARRQAKLTVSNVLFTQFIVQ